MGATRGIDMKKKTTGSFAKKIFAYLICVLLLAGMVPSAVMAESSNGGGYLLA
jgi:hypothetical protein